MSYPRMITAINDMILWLKMYQDKILDIKITVIETILNSWCLLKLIPDSYPEVSIILSAEIAPNI